MQRLREEKEQPDLPVIHVIHEEKPKGCIDRAGLVLLVLILAYVLVMVSRGERFDDRVHQKGAITGGAIQR